MNQYSICSGFLQRCCCGILLLLPATVVFPADAPNRSNWTAESIPLNQSRVQTGRERSLAVWSENSDLRYYWNLDERTPTPFGYSLSVTCSMKQSGKGIEDRRQMKLPAVISPDLRHLAIGAESGAIHIVDLAKRDKPSDPFYARQLKPGRASEVAGIRPLAFYGPADKIMLIARQGDQAFSVWDLGSGEQLNVLAVGQREKEISIVPGPDDSFLIRFQQEVRRTDSAIRKWEAQRRFRESIVGFAVSDYRQVIAVATADSAITILDTRSLDVLRTINGEFLGADISLALDANGDRLFATTRDGDGVVGVWDVKTGRKSGSFRHPKLRGGTQLQISVTSGGKVKTIWNNLSVDSALLWSPPGGVQLLPPTDIYFVYGTAVKVARLNGRLISNFRITRVIFGRPDLEGSYFTVNSNDIYGATGSERERSTVPSVTEAEEGFWWIKSGKREGDLIAELDAKRLSIIDRYGILPARDGPELRQNGIIEEQFRDAKLFAETYKRLGLCTTDEEREKTPY